MPCAASAAGRPRCPPGRPRCPPGRGRSRAAYGPWHHRHTGRAARRGSTQATEARMTAGLEHTWVAHYADGVPAEIDPPTGSLVDLLTEAVATYGPRPALEFFGAEVTYAELGRRVELAAEGLRRLGVRAGDRVALVLPNCPEHIVAFYAVLRLRAVVVEHNPLYTATEMAHQFEDHGARVAVVWDKVAGTVAALPGVDHVVAVDLTASMPWTKRLALRLPVRRARELRSRLTAPSTGTTPWADLLGHGPLEPTVTGPTVDDLAAIQYTSGTTGHPKGAMLSHSNLLAN